MPRLPKAVSQRTARMRFSSRKSDTNASRSIAREREAEGGSSCPDKRAVPSLTLSGKGGKHTTSLRSPTRGLRRAACASAAGMRGNTRRENSSEPKKSLSVSNGLLHRRNARLGIRTCLAGRCFKNNGEARALAPQVHPKKAMPGMPSRHRPRRRSGRRKTRCSRGRMHGRPPRARHTPTKR